MNSLSRNFRNLLVVAGAVALSSCGLFGGDDEELEPAELIDFKSTVAVKRIWSSKLGGDAEFLRVALQPVGDGNNIYAASQDGRVSAFNPENGRLVWRTKLDIELSAGPGVGGGLLVVNSKDGYVIALDRNDGSERWRAYVSGESLARPLVRDETVIVQTVDNRLRALSSFDGTERWTVIQSTPALTMRGSASPVSVGSTVVAGFDNGRVIAVDVSTGDIQWESLLAPPTGRSDLDRLSDVDGAMATVGQDVYASGYQGRIASLAAESGQVLWAREISSYVGVTADWNNLYTTQVGGDVIAMSRRTGTESWRQDALLRREPTVPVSFGPTVVVGDLEGYLHFFSSVDGEPVARVRFGKAAISTPPVVVANRLYVQSDSGSISAYAIQEPKRSRKAPDIADEDA